MPLEIKKPTFDTTTRIRLVVKIATIQSILLFVAIFISGLLNHYRAALSKNSK